MTLIAGFKTSEGAVVCADSQETLGLPLPNNDFAEYRVSVDKIEPQQVGNYDLVIGGAGHGPLVEGFTETLTDQIETWNANLDGGALKDKIRHVVLDYHRHEVAVCPAEDKDIQFLICLKQKHDLEAEIHLWTVRGSAIKRVRDYALIGWEEGIYRHDIDRHYRGGEKNLYSMLVGVHVLMLARETSNNVGGPIKIVAATPIGFRAVAPEDAEELERRVADFESTLDALRLRICDTTIPLDDFNQGVSNFQTAVLNLRTTLTCDVILSKFTRFKDAPKNVDELPAFLPALFDPYLGLPTLDESIRAFRAAWNSVTVNRRGKRDLALASYYLSHVSHAMVETTGAAYQAKVITLEQRRELARRLHQISEAGGSVLNDLKKINSDPVPDAQVNDVYARLTEQVVDPLLVVVSDLTKLPEPSNEHANQLNQSLYSALLSIFTMAFVSPFSKEPQPLPEPPKQLGS